MADDEKEQALAALRRRGGLALLWFGLTGLAYAPTATAGLTTSAVLAFGFLSFAFGLTLFANAIKRELLSELQSSESANPGSDRS